MEILRYYDTVFEAEVARGRLESESITAIVQNENLGGVIPLTAIQSLKPCLAVRGEDLTRAAGILGMEIHKEDDVRQCPECGADEIVFGFFYKDKPVGRLASIVMLPFFMLAAMHTGNIRRAYNCRRCGNWF